MDASTVAKAEKRQAKGSAMSQLFHPVFVLLLLVHSIVLLFPAPLSYTSVSFPLSCCLPFSAQEHRLLAIVTIIEEKRKRTRRNQRSSPFTAASRKGSDTRKTANKHKAYKGHSQRIRKRYEEKATSSVLFRGSMKLSLLAALPHRPPGSSHISR
jgi:hypothetical protein